MKKIITKKTEVEILKKVLLIGCFELQKRDKGEKIRKFIENHLKEVEVDVVIVCQKYKPGECLRYNILGKDKNYDIKNPDLIVGITCEYVPREAIMYLSGVYKVPWMELEKGRVRCEEDYSYYYENGYLLEKIAFNLLKRN